MYVRAQRQEEHIQAQMYTEADTTAEKIKEKELAREQVFFNSVPFNRA